MKIKEIFRINLELKKKINGTTKMNEKMGRIEDGDEDYSIKQ